MASQYLRQAHAQVGGFVGPAAAAPVVFPLQQDHGEAIDFIRATASRAALIRRVPRLHHRPTAGNLGLPAATTVVVQHDDHDETTTMILPNMIIPSSSSVSSVSYNYFTYHPEEETVILGTVVRDRHGGRIASGNGLSGGVTGHSLRTRKSCPEDKHETRICSVCLDDLCRDDHDEIGVLDNCRHEFHVGCITQWLRKKNICPLCRAVGLGRRS
ncbi:hypothetical protein OROHE_016039 [Orobanche hederae]